MTMKNISAGDLRHMITLQRDNGSINSSGGMPAQYTVLGTFYARVEAVSADEAVNGEKKKGIRHYKVTMRNNAEVRPTDQILWNGIKLNVKSSLIDPFGILIEIEATEWIANQ